MSATIHINTSGFQHELTRLVAVGRKSAAEIIKQQGKLFVRDLIKMTPPFGNAPVTESFAKQREAGKIAVLQQIGRTMLPASQIDTPFILAILKGRTTKKRKAGREEAERRLRLLQGMGAARIDELADPAWHASQRDRRGRVRGRFRNVFIKNEASLRRYIREKQDHVGKAKSGWKQAASMVGFSLPAWITKHTGGAGIAEQRLTGDRPFLRVGNLIDWIQDSGAGLRIVQRALDNRVRNMKIMIENIFKYARV